jgi:hypothetical protein
MLRANDLASFAWSFCADAATVHSGYFGIRDKQGPRLSVQCDSKDNTHHENQQYRRAPTHGRS